MPLADGIRAVRDRALSDLTAAHDYHADTVMAWRFLGEDILAGKKISVTNAVTGTVTTESELAARIPVYATVRLAEATFQTFLSIFEAFLSDFLRAWLRAYPGNLRSTGPVDVATILDAADKAEVVEFVIDRAVLDFFYKKPADWFAHIEKKLGLGCPTPDEIGRLAEAKATRDVLIHNRGVANDVYRAKAGSRARFAVGERVDVPEPYHRETWNLLQKVVADLSDAVIRKFP